MASLEQLAADPEVRAALARMPRVAPLPEHLTEERKLVTYTPRPAVTRLQRLGVRARLGRKVAEMKHVMKAVQKRRASLHKLVCHAVECQEELQRKIETIEGMIYEFEKQLEALK